MERIDPLDPIDKIDPADPIETKDPTENADPNDKTDPSDPAENADPTARQHPTDHQDPEENNPSLTPADATRQEIGVSLRPTRPPRPKLSHPPRTVAFVRSLDTHPESHRVQIEALRRTSPDRRTAMAVELTHEVRKIAVDGVRQRHPEYDDETVHRALMRLLYGDEVFRRVWPDAPLVAR